MRVLKPATVLIVGLLLVLPGVAQRPNIVLFMADDMAWYDCGAYGSKQVATPNIDQLARDGMRFDNMFTSTAMCAPTRQQLLTGLWPVRNGAYPNHSLVYSSVKSIVNYLQEVGYRTGLAGKTHFGPDESFPFERIESKLTNERTFKKIDEFINREDSQPYFLMIASNEPHVPWNQGDVSQYQPDDIELPAYLVDTRETRESVSKYFAEITFMDQEVGRCMELIEKANQSSNTIFIFTSEQGPQLPYGKWTCYDHGLKTAFVIKWPGEIEPGSSNSALTQYVDVVPTLLEAVAGSSQVDTGVSDTFGHRGFDGDSFLKILKATDSGHRKYVYGVHTTRGILDGSETYPIRSVRSDQYLYIRNLSFESEFQNVITVRNRGDLLESWYQKGEIDSAAMKRAELYEYRPYEELYDVQKDPDLLNNLAKDQMYRGIKSELEERLDKWMLQQGDLGVATEMKALTRQRKYINRYPDSNRPIEKK